MLGVLLTPSSYPSDWYGWSVNQMGHLIVGLIVAYVAAALTGSAKRGALIAVVLCTAWEALAWLLNLLTADPLDKVTDALFMASGAALGLLLWDRSKFPLAVAALAICAALWVGVEIRI